MLIMTLMVRRSVLIIRKPISMMKTSVLLYSLKNGKYELINAEGENVLKSSYPRLEFIGNSYYAAYNKNGQFKVYDCNGKEALSDVYTKIPEKAAIVFDGHPYLALEKNGRSYIYDVDNDMKENLLY